MHVFSCFLVFINLNYNVQFVYKIMDILILNLTYYLLPVLGSLFCNKAILISSRESSVRIRVPRTFIFMDGFSFDELY